MKRLVAIFVVALLAIASVSAADSKLPYIDVEAANARIAYLEATTQEYTQEITEKTQTNSSLEGDIAGWQQQVIEIDPILQRVNGELTDLFAVNRTIVDEELKGRSQEAIGRARTIKRGLETQMRTLNAQVDSAKEEIDSNRERVRILNNRIVANEEEAAFLQAAIVQTQAQQDRVDTYIVNVDGILSDAEKFLDDTTATE